MFDKFKQMAQLRGLQDEIAKERFEAEIDGVKVVVSGALAVEDVVLNPGLNIEEQANTVKKCTNEALKKAQVGAAKKLAGMNLFG
jgi:DNA-binding protein YbaB